MEDREKKKYFWKGALCGALAIFIAGSGAVGAAHIASMRRKNPMELKMEYLRELVDQKYLYVDEISDEALEEGAYKGYIHALGDPYSGYYDGEETRSLFEESAGEYYGIGVAFSQNIHTKISTAVQVYEGSPAEEAGMSVGDVLYKVNGENISGKELSEIVKLIKGEEGTQVELTVLRGEDGREVTMDVTRRKIEVQTVTYEMKEDGVGYIHIKEFDKVTGEQFGKAMEKLQSDGMKGVVIDLRSNPGGNMGTVVEILDTLLPEGKIVYTKDKQGTEVTYSSDAEHRFEKPMVVLVNDFSASAAEIFAGAVQDYGVGTIVGTTTYGKGIVQQLIPLSDGTCLKLTTAEYFTPKGRNIHKIGIEPDIEVAYERVEDAPEADNQLDAALVEVKRMIAEQGE